MNYNRYNFIRPTDSSGSSLFENILFEIVFFGILTHWLNSTINNRYEQLYQFVAIPFVNNTPNQQQKKNTQKLTVMISMYH